MKDFKSGVTDATMTARMEVVRLARTSGGYALVSAHHKTYTISYKKGEIVRWKSATRHSRRAAVNTKDADAHAIPMGSIT